MTTAPIAPRTSSSHMNQKRVWPGVPNRYSIKSRSIEIRPKSIATVVVVFPGTLRVSSTPTPAEVMMASVVSGVISETEPTSVVLPTPNPPAMTIFADVTRPDERCVMSEPPKSTQHPLKQFCANRLVFVQRGRLIHRDQPIRRHVGDDDPGHAERQLHARRDFRERLQPAITQRGNILLLLSLVSTGAGIGLTAPHRGLDQRLDRDIQSGPGATTGDGVRPDQRTGRFIALGHCRRSPPRSFQP